MNWFWNLKNFTMDSRAR